MILLFIKNLSMVVLLDVYGSLLTESRKAYMHLYYEEDLSLSEIAQMMNVTRQAVHDSVRRSTKLLLSTEDKLHCAEKYVRIRNNYEALGIAASHLEESKEKVDILKLIREGIAEL